MKKTTTGKKIVAIILALTFLFAMATTAYAYSPSSGSSSGRIVNNYKSNVCIYDLPKGTIHINYTLSETNNMQLRFYKNAQFTGGYQYAQLVEGSRTTTVVLDADTTYYVVLWSNNNIPKTFSYSYNLY